MKPLSLCYGKGQQRFHSARNNRLLRFESLECRELLSAEPSWAAEFGSTWQDRGNSVEVDTQGHVFVAGTIDGVGDNGDAYDYGNAYIAKYVTAQDGTPVLEKSLRLTTNGVHAGAQSIALDSGGNVIVMGNFTGDVDFDPGPAQVLRTASSYDQYVAKYDATLSTLLWVVTLPDAGTYSGQGQLMTLRELAGTTEILLTGHFSNALAFDGDITGGEPVINVSGASTTAYVAKLLDSGSSVEFGWARQVPDTGYVRVRGLAVSPSGEVYVGGLAGTMGGGGSFGDPATIGGATLLNSGGGDAFMAKLDGTTAEVEWVHRIGGGTGLDELKGIAISGTGVVFVSGTFRSSASFDTWTGAVVTFQAPGTQVFVARIKERAAGAGADNLWVTALQGSNDVQTWGGLVLDEAAVEGVTRTRLFLGGTFNESAELGPDPTYSSYGGWDAFIAELDGNGQKVNAWQMGGSAVGEGLDSLTPLDRTSGLAIDHNGLVYSTGYFFAPQGRFLTQDLTSHGQRDGFVVRLNPDAPVVSIGGPTTISENGSGPLTYSGTVLQAPYLSSQLSWTLDGAPVGSGSSVTPSTVGLALGHHSLVAAVTNASGIQGSFTFRLKVAPAAPTSLSAAVQGTSVTLNWTNNSASVTGFEIWKVAKPKGNSPPAWGTARVIPVGSNLTSYTDQNVSGSFYYRVRAYYTLVGDEKVYSDFSNEILVSVGGGGKKK